jgi:hypothetical protein
MALFSPEELEALSASTVRLATLVDFDWVGAPTYLWNGTGTRVFAGKTYIGCGDVGSIEGLEEARGTQANQVTFTLSGVADSPADLLAKAIDDTDIVQGRVVAVSIQLFNQDWAVLSDPILIWFGFCQQPRVTREAASTEVGARRILTLPAEGMFVGRARPAAGRYTDREQQARFPGDLFCTYVSQLVNKSVIWPDFTWLFAIGLSSIVALSGGLA